MHWYATLMIKKLELACYLWSKKILHRQYVLNHYNHYNHIKINSKYFVLNCHVINFTTLHRIDLLNIVNILFFAGNYCLHCLFLSKISIWYAIITFFNNPLLFIVYVILYAQKIVLNWNVLRMPFIIKSLSKCNFKKKWRKCVTEMQFL